MHDIDNFHLVMANVKEERRENVWGIIKLEVVPYIKNSRHIFHGVRGINPEYALELIDLLIKKNRLGEIIKSIEDLGYLLLVCRKENDTAIFQKIAYLISDFIKGAEDIKSLYGTLCSEILGGADKIMDLVLSPKILTQLGLNKIEDIPDGLSYRSLTEVVTFKIKERQAIEVFFEHCPNWRGKNASQVNSMNEILDYVRSEKQTPNCFINPWISLETQARIGLQKCGVDRHIFLDKKMPLTEIVDLIYTQNISKVVVENKRHQK